VNRSGLLGTGIIVLVPHSGSNFFSILITILTLHGVVHLPSVDTPIYSCFSARLLPFYFAFGVLLSWVLGQWDNKTKAKKNKRRYKEKHQIKCT